MISVDAELLHSKIKKLLQHFVKLGIVDNISCDKALGQFIPLIQNEFTLNLDQFKSFDVKETAGWFLIPCIEYSKVHRASVYC